jgi:low affinity Fe/Cu permease
MNNLNPLEKASYKFTNWIGTPGSILVHTLIFALFTTLVLKGVDFNRVMLIWNTSVSLEAIYLALFIQMTVNRHTESLEDLEEEVEDISEDIEDIQEDEKDEIKKVATLDHIEVGLQRLIQEVETLKARTGNGPKPQTH